VADGLSDKVAIVTGATRGIGLGIARELVASGARVCITARKPDELASAVADLGSEAAMSAQGSADDVDHQQQTVAACLERFGRLDLLVNNAGINPHFGPVLDADLGVLRKTFEVNVFAALGWTRAAWSGALAERGGAVLNVASIGGVRIGPALGVYNATKAALIHLTGQLAQELAPGVRVNAIAPAVVKTRFARALYEGREEEAAAPYPLGRLGEPADTAKLAAFLLSDDAGWITGECVVIDGGLSVTGALPF
jgi:NAD(P)-dependent dehydrogenase (short-subunit alcohol dehydrogenase family)